MPPADPIWNHFNKLGHVLGFRQARAQCKYCSHEVNAAANKCIKHFKICSKANITMLQEYFGADFQPNAQQRSNSLSPTGTTLTTLQSTNNFVDRSSSTEKEAELLFAQAVYRCGLFLSLPELDPIKILFQKLCPNFKLPSQKTLSTTLLDKVYFDVKNEVNNLINSAEYICLISDGWSNMMQERWTNYLITTPKQIFFSAHQTVEAKQTDENIAQNIDQIVLQIDHSKLSAIITDNTPLMKKAWKILAIKYPQVIFLGCITHSLNILIEDIMKLPWADTTIKNGKKIVKYFKSNQVSAGILKRYQLSNYSKRISLKLPTKGRWESSAVCLNSLHVNRLAIELAITELSRNQNVKIENDVKNIVSNDGFWQDIDNLYKVLNQLIIGISIFESDTPSLSKVLDWYYNQLESAVEDEVKKIIEKGWKNIYHPVIEIAHLLDPSFHGRHLTSNSMNKISKFVQKYYSNDAVTLWTQILNYKEKRGTFANKLAWETCDKVDPITWWSGNFSVSAPELTQMAKRILSIPTSSAASEINWPAFAYIHDKKRNQLTADRVLKLVYIYSNYKLQMPREISEWKELLMKLNKNTSLDEDNVDDKIQGPVKSEESDSEGEYLSSSSSESEGKSFDYETDNSNALYD